MPIININKPTFVGNIRKYAKKPLNRMKSPNLSRFLLETCKRIKSGNFDDKNFLIKLSKVHISMCTHFECVLIYELLRICYNLNPPKNSAMFAENKHSINPSNISFKDCPPEGMNEIKNIINHLCKNDMENDDNSDVDNSNGNLRAFAACAPVPRALSDKLVNHRNEWRNSIREFRKLAKNGDIFARNNKVYDNIEELENKITKNKNKRIISDNIWAQYLKLVKEPKNERVISIDDEKHKREYGELKIIFETELAEKNLKHNDINDMIKLKILAERESLTEQTLKTYTQELRNRIRARYKNGGSSDSRETSVSGQPARPQRRSAIVAPRELPQRRSITGVQPARRRISSSAPPPLTAPSELEPQATPPAEVGQHRKRPLTASYPGTRRQIRSGFARRQGAQVRKSTHTPQELPDQSS